MLRTPNMVTERRTWSGTETISGMPPPGDQVSHGDQMAARGHTSDGVVFRVLLRRRASGRRSFPTVFQKAVTIGFLKRSKDKTIRVRISLGHTTNDVRLCVVLRICSATFIKRIKGHVSVPCFG
jgi:hypothetical protein